MVPIGGRGCTQNWANFGGWLGSPRAESIFGAGARKMETASREEELPLDWRGFPACPWKKAVVKGLSCPSCPRGCGLSIWTILSGNKKGPTRAWGWESPLGPRRRARRGIAPRNRPGGSVASGASMRPAYRSHARMWWLPTRWDVPPLARGALDPWTQIVVVLRRWWGYRMACSPGLGSFRRLTRLQSKVAER